MTDLRITDDGDLMISSTGDLEVMETRFHNYAQQAYIRLMTETGDFLAYPELGADLVKLVGMPNTPTTADYGRELILSSFKREGVFDDLGVDVVPVPTGRFAIRFDIYVTAGSRQQLILSIEQDLTSIGTETGLALTDGNDHVLGAG